MAAKKELILPPSVRSVDLATQRSKQPAQMGRRSSRAAPMRQGPSARPGGSDIYSEIGTSGLKQFGGFILEEWLVKLRGRYGAWAYREMMDNSPIAAGILFAIKMLARQVEWTVEDDVEVSGLDTGFCESNMHDMSHTWGDLVSEILSMVGYGWSFHEEVFKRRQGPNPIPTRFLEPEENGANATEEGPDDAPPSSRYSDGRIGWRRLPIRAQETTFRWIFKNYSLLRGMEQIDWHGGKHKIPIGKALLFRTETTRQNPEGRSLLRAAWTSYFALQNIQAIEAIGIERDLAGLPVLTPPEGTDLNAPENEGLLRIAIELVTGIRRDEDEGVVLPSAGWELELMSGGGSRQIDTDTIIRRYEQRMTVSLLADFLLLGQDALGSYAMVDIKSELFGVAVDVILDMVCEVFNRYAFPRLLALNGMRPKKMPQLRHSSAGRMDLRTVGEFLTNLSLAGAPIPWTQPLMEHLFAGGALPKPEFDVKPIVPPMPNEQARDTQWRPSWGSENTPAPSPPSGKEHEHVAKADTRQGAMVAFYPSLEAARAIAQAGGEPADEVHLTLAFLGDAAAITDPDRLQKVVEGFAATCPPITGHIAGTGLFTASEENVLYASPDTPALPHARQRLVEQLEHAGFPPEREHGFTPHLTLAYGHDGAPPAVSRIPLQFDHLTLKLGDQRFDYPLAPAALEKADPVRDGQALNLAPVLSERARILSLQLERELLSALDQLGNEVGRSYATVAQKAMTPRDLQRLIGRVMAETRVADWVNLRLKPILRNHAARVVGDVSRVVGQQVGRNVNIPEGEVHNIQMSAGHHLKITDVSPQVRDSIERAIREGVAAGDNPVKTGQRIRENVPKGRFVHAGVPYRAQLIAREETATLMRASSVAAYEAMGNVAELEAVDGIYGPPRSDQFCMDRSGTRVPIREAKDLIRPAHPLCTLGWNPVVSLAPEGEWLADRLAA